MRTQNVSKFEQERNQSRQHCILKDLQTVAVVQTVPLCCLGSCSLVFVCTHENPSVPTCVKHMMTTRQVEHGSVEALVESDGSSRPGTRVTGGRIKVEGDNSG